MTDNATGNKPEANPMNGVNVPIVASALIKVLESPNIGRLLFLFPFLTIGLPLTVVCLGFLYSVYIQTKTIESNAAQLAALTSSLIEIKSAQIEHKTNLDVIRLKLENLSIQQRYEQNK